MDGQSASRPGGAAWPFHAALATSGDARLALAVLTWPRASAPARSTLLTADTVEEAAAILIRVGRGLRGRSVHGPLRGLDPTNLLTAWTSVPVPPALRGARPFGDLLATGPLERRVAAATLLEQRPATGLRFTVERLAEAFAILHDVQPPRLLRRRAHGPAAAPRATERGA